MSLDELAAKLVERLAQPLPAADAHVRLAPRPRPGWKPGALPAATRPGAGLVLFHPHDGVPHVVLTVRSKHLPSHRGQVSLPGGAVESGETIEEAALREAEEEVGLARAEVRVLGRLSPLHIPASGYILYPVVGVTVLRTALTPAEAEVERILEIALGDLMDPERLRVESREMRGQPVEVPFFLLGGEKVWGATAMILAELLQVLGADPDPWRSSAVDPGSVRIEGARG